MLGTCSRTEGRRTLLLAGMCLFVALLAAPIRPGVVVGESMAPEFHSGQVFLSSSASAPTALRVGDVVLVSVAGQIYLKRIYAVEGETVWGLRSPDMSEGFDRVIAAKDVSDMRRLTRRHPGLGEVAQIQVPEGHVYVLGDSANNSYDSRSFGPVPTESVRACVVVKNLGHLWRSETTSTQLAVATTQSPP